MWRDALNLLYSPEVDVIGVRQYDDMLGLGLHRRSSCRESAAARAGPRGRIWRIARRANQRRGGRSPRRRGRRRLRLADRDCRRLLGGANAHPRRDRPRERAQHLRRRARLALGDGRDARVAALADLDVERDAAEVLELVALRRTSRRRRGRRSRSPRRSAGRRTRSCSRRRPSPARSGAGTSPAPSPRPSTATSCGVVTSSAPEMGTAWASVSCASEVPGGRSMTR